MNKNTINILKTRENDVMRLLSLTKTELRKILNSSDQEKKLNEILDQKIGNKNNVLKKTID